MAKRAMNIGTRLVVSILAVVVTAVAVMAVVVGIQMTGILRDQGEQLAAETARHWASVIKAELEVPLDEARALAEVFEAASNVEGVSLTRRKANMILQYFMENNPNFLGVYLAFEPDAYDGHDDNFVNERGHDATGRFIPYWTLDADGNGVLEPLMGYDQAGDGDYYQLPKQRGRECVIDPYLYPIQGVDVMLTSLVVPIQDSSGDFKGIAGIDLALDKLQEMVSSIELDGLPSAYVTFYSANGTVVANKNAETVGSDIDELGYDEDFANAVLGTEEFSLERMSGYLGKKVLTFGTRAPIGYTQTNWTVAVNIPEDELFAATRRMTVLLVGIGLAAAVIAMIAAYLISRSISKPIRLITEGSQRLSRGDIKLEGMDQNQIAQINDRGDEIGDIGRAFSALIEYMGSKATLAREIADKNLRVDVSVESQADELGTALQDMVASLNELLGQITESIDQVTSGAEQVSQSSQSLSQGAAEQASSLEEVSSSVTEINSQSQGNAENAVEANALAKDAANNAESGNAQMKQLTEAMEAINASAGEIGKVVKVIDDIAFQINLLALNANVEAARAGKYGKGFAVVANEVRNLAVRSAEAVKETSGMVEESVSNIERGNQSVGATAKELEGIVEGISKVAGLLDEITAASKEQANGIEQVTGGLDQIDQVTQANTASAEESASASEELATQADQIRSLIREFRLRQGQDAPTSGNEAVFALEADQEAMVSVPIVQSADQESDTGSPEEVMQQG